MTQPRCNQAKNRIYRILSTEAHRVPDSLQTILDLTTFVRACEDDIALELELWLLNNEVFALDGLERYAEASDLVDHFFAVHFESADDHYRARFHLWRLHLKAMNGDFIEMVANYTEAQRYAASLNATHRASLYLDGAYAYIGIREHEKALRLTQEAQDLIGEPESYEERIVRARAMLLGAEAQFWLGTRLEEAKQTLRAALELYNTLGDTAQAAMATTVLGMAYAAEGDTSRALTEMSTAVRLAQQAGHLRSRVYTLYRWGQLLREAGDFEAAEPVLLQAKNASTTFREFYLRILYELARLYEQRRGYDRGEIEAIQKALEGQNRLLLIEHARSRLLLWLALFGVLALLGFVGVGVYWHLQRRAILKQLQQSIVLPEMLKTGLSLEALNQRFQKNVDWELLGRRLSRIHAVLFQPELVLSYVEEVEDDYIVRQVKEDDLDNNTALFKCVAAMEIIIDGETFKGDPANSVASYLRGEFKKRGWDWPKNPPAWKQHILKHHAEALF